MRLRYENTIEDLLAFQTFTLAHSPVIKRTLALMRWGGAGVIFIALCVICGLSPVTYTVGLIAAAVYALYYPARFQRRFKNQLQKQYAGGDAKGVLGPHELEVLADSLIERTPYNETRTAWSAIEKIESTPEHTFIYLNSMMAHIIPHHAIAEGNYTAFMEKVRQSYRSDALLTENKL